MMLRLSLLLLALSSVTAHAYGTLDRRFGEAGMTRLGFQAVQGDRADYGTVACSGPAGSLVVSGFASGRRRVVTAWLTEGGGLARQFGLEGKQSFDLPRGVGWLPRGLCLPDGKIMLMHEAVDAQDDSLVVLIRIDPQTGLPDPGFGTQGRVEVDLDTLQAGLGKFEFPFYLSAGRNGELLVSGIYSLGSINDREAGFVLRLAANGAVLSSTFAHIDDPGVTGYGAVLPAGDGTLWATHFRTQPDTVRVAGVVRLDETTLAPLSMVQSPISHDFTPERAVMLDPATMAVGGNRAGGKPVIAIVRADALATLSLPERGAAERTNFAQVAALPDGDILFGATYRSEASHEGRGQYFARVQRGPDGNLSLDEAFGTNGVLATAHPPLAACPDRPVEQEIRRFTYWKGRPTAVGLIDTSCDPAAEDLDYLVVRVDLDAVFGGGFE